jgi:hypothetical protein
MSNHPKIDGVLQKGRGVSHAYAQELARYNPEGFVFVDGGDAGWVWMEPVGVKAGDLVVLVDQNGKTDEILLCIQRIDECGFRAEDVGEPIPMPGLVWGDTKEVALKAIAAKCLELLLPEEEPVDHDHPGPDCKYLGSGNWNCGVVDQS